jgi:NADH-quinone oxidoreductase subunit L
MVVSVLVALGGIVIAWIMYIKLPDLPAKIATAHHRLYQLILDKYRIDELYHAAIVQPVLGLNDGIGMFDNFVVDGAVNASGSSTATGSQVTGYFDNQGVDAGVNMVGAGVRGAGHNIRQIQTGRIKSYLTTSLAGLLAVIFLFVLWLGIAHWIRHGL